METTMIKSVDDLKKEILSVSGRVIKLENLSTDLTVKVMEFESSCQAISNLFDNADKQIKTNTRNIIHHDQRLKKLEENPNESNADRTESISFFRSSTLFIIVVSITSILLPMFITYSAGHWVLMCHYAPLPLFSCFPQ
jgi:hypothetical protein